MGDVTSKIKCYKRGRRGYLTLNECWGGVVHTYTYSHKVTKVIPSKLRLGK